MADQPVTREKLINADKDVQVIEDFIKKPKDETVTTRFGDEIMTLKGLEEEVKKSGGYFKRYTSLSAANADIANIPVNSVVKVTDAVNGGDYEKATSEATSLTKSPYDPITIAAADATEKANNAKDQAIEASNEHLKTKIFQIDYKVNMVPLYVDKNRNVPVYLENGGLSFSFLGDKGKIAIVNSLKNEGVFVESVEASNLLQPLVVDENKNVPLYLEKGLLGFSGLAPRSLKEIQSIINPYSTALPIATDGRTLWRYKAKCAKRKADGSGVVKVMTIGDSYMQLTPIPQAIANVLRAQHGNGGRGWITAGEETYIDGITSTFAGAWTRYDRQNTNALTDKGYAIDGQSRSTVASGARWVLNNVPAKQLTVYYLDNDAVFDFGYYNAGTPTWQTVTGTNTGTIKSVTISGATAETSIFEVKRTSGTVFIYGFYAAGTAQTGVVVDACGNSGSTSTNLLNMTTEFGYEHTFNALDPDLILFTLGTNDASVTSGVKTFKDDVNALIDNFRRLSPTVSIVLIAPPRTNQESSNRTPLSVFRDVLYEIALNKQCEFLNLHDEWQSYSRMNALNLFLDDVHPNLAGGTYIAELLTKKLGI